MRISQHVLAVATLLLLWAGSPWAQIAYVGASSASLQSGSTTTIQFISSGSSSSSSSGSITPTLPTGGTTGDMYICLVESHDTNTHSTPTGWTNYYDRYDTLGTHHSSMWYRFNTGSTPSNPTFTHTGASIVGRCAMFRGVDTSSPFDVSFVGQESTSSSSLQVDTPAIDPITSGTLVLFNAHINNNPSSLNWPGGWNEAFYTKTSSGNDSAIGMAWYLNTSGAQLGPLTATFGSNQPGISTGTLVALKPLANSGTSLTVAVPAGTSTGNVMIASVTVTPSSATVVSPAGWTLIRSTTQSSGGTGRLYTYWRAATASEPASYTWTLSGSHTGAVGAITTFSGADNATPVDVESGAATASGTSHSTPSVTTAYANDYLVTTHVYFSSNNWTPNSGQTETMDRYSAASAGSSGVSMVMAYLAQATAGATGAIQATPTAGSNDTGIAHIVALRKNVPLTCVSYDFNGATPLADWSLSSSGGSPVPSVVNGRLRLTDNAGNRAGAAHLTGKKFPASGQKIVVEFDYYGYNGSGADGIAFTLSDASVTPSAGGYGGSLGYAQRTGVNGFAGGWLGIGIDEYGNYSNPTEGRTGTGTNSGFYADAVAVRGSGSGTTGYTFLAGSGSLSPGIDSNLSSTPAPGHRYRVTVDHSNGTNAWTTIERDTGAGYVTVISRFDPKSNGSQAAVPANWYLSYTGSTGGSTNIHEIDNLSICAATIVSSGPVSFAVTAPATGSVCGSAGGSPSSPTITITAKDGPTGTGNTVTSYTGSVTLSTSTGHGSFAKATANGTLSGNVYTFSAADNGTATFYLTNTYAENLTVTATEVAPGTASGTSATLVYSDLVFVITPVTTTQPENTTTTLVAGRPHQVKAELWRKDSGTGACAIDTAYTGAKNLDGWYSPTASQPVGAAAPTLCPYTGGACSTSGCTSALPSTAPTSSPSSNNFTGVTFANGTANFCVATTDVGQFSLNLRDDTRSYSTTTDIGGAIANSNLTVRPFALYAKGASGNPQGVSNYLAAGDTFNATVYAVLWNATLASTIDTNNDGNPDFVSVSTFTPTTTPSYSGTTVLSRGTVVTPPGGSGSLNGAGTTSINWSGGVGTPTANTLYMDNVGTFTLKASVSSYLGLSSIPYISDVFGRFYPYYFLLKPGTGSVTAACGGATGMTYMGQAFSVAYTLQALSKQGAVTSNYGTGYTGTFVTPSLVAEDATYAGTNLGSRISGVAAASWSGGEYAVSSATAIFSRPTSPGANSGVPISNWGGPFGTISAASLSIGVSADEPVSGRFINGANMRADTAGVCTTATSVSTDCNATQLPTGSPTRMFYGRFNLGNAFGSERLTLPVMAQTEYYNGTGWAVNTLDNCTALQAAPTLTQNFTAGSIAAKCNGVTCTIGSAVTAGDLRLTLVPSTSPAMGTGYVDIGLNVPTWLEYPWHSATAADPTARATLGIYKNNNRLIFRRERY